MKAASLSLLLVATTLFVVGCAGEKPQPCPEFSGPALEGDWRWSAAQIQGELMVLDPATRRMLRLLPDSIGFMEVSGPAVEVLYDFGGTNVRTAEFPGEPETLLIQTEERSMWGSMDHTFDLEFVADLEEVGAIWTWEAGPREERDRRLCRYGGSWRSACDRTGLGSSRSSHGGVEGSSSKRCLGGGMCRSEAAPNRGAFGRDGLRPGTWRPGLQAEPGRRPF